MKLYSFFHLNLMFSSIEESERTRVVDRCYWPLLRLIERLRVPVGIEMTGITVEALREISPQWITRFRALLDDGVCDLIGSGYAQVIGPLVPAEVNRANLFHGNRVYREMFDYVPHTALVNEQAYSSGIIEHYLHNGYRSIIMEWNNPAAFHANWSDDMRFAPARVMASTGEEMGLIWNDCIAFQKFQRCAHNEMSIDDYCGYLHERVASGERAFCIYGNDAEIFDFRPGRFGTEPGLPVEDSEWGRIESMYARLNAHGDFHLVGISDIAEMTSAGPVVRLESAGSPVPVKKQGKYNLNRWAVTGHDDLGVNTQCYELARRLTESETPLESGYWRSLCYLWSSDFRTHITDTRYAKMLQELAHAQRHFPIRKRASVERDFGGGMPATDATSGIADYRVDRRGDIVSIHSPSMSIEVNLRRGMAITRLGFPDLCLEPLCGTLPHGYFDDISMGADYYSGHLVCEILGTSKVTDLERVVPTIEEHRSCISLCGKISSVLGTIRKELRVNPVKSMATIHYDLDDFQFPQGCLRLGFVTLIPSSFEKESLFFATHNGGASLEVFSVGDRDFEHGTPVSLLVSASQAVGMTEGVLLIGDRYKCIELQIDKSQCAAIALLQYKQVNNGFFFRVCLSLRELDETARNGVFPSPVAHRRITLAMRAGYTSRYLS